MRDVLAFAGFAEAVALDRAREDDARRAFVLARGFERVVDLDRIVPAERHLLQLVVRQVLDHVEQPRVRAPEMIAHVRARLDGVLLILPVDDLAHALHEQALTVLGEQRIPFTAPDRLDHVPAGAAERRFELLDDLAVAAHRTVEPLQVAVDDKDEIVEFLARRQRDRAERFGLVGFAVTEKRPDFRGRRRLQPAILEIAHEARLVDRHQRAKAHRDRGVFPEVGHQPGVRVGRQGAARHRLAAEILEMRLVDASFEVGARVDPGRRVALEVDHVAVGILVTPEEMVEADFVQRGGRRKGRNVPADAFFGLVRAHNHGRGVPAHEALDPALEIRTARHEHLVVGRDGVDIRGVRGEGKLDAALAGVNRQLAEQARHLCGATALQHIIKRVEPLSGFGLVQFRRVFRSDVSHGSGILSALGDGRPSARLGASVSFCRTVGQQTLSP